MAREGFSVEYFCYENIGYSPKYVDELFDILEECSKMVRYYLDTSVGYPDELKSDIHKLSMDIDNLYLDFSTTYILIARLINATKKEFFLSRKIKADKRLAKDISQMINRLDKDLEKVVEKTRAYMKRIHVPKPISAA